MDFKKQAAAKAVTLVKNGYVLGLGAGSTMAHAVSFLKEDIEKGLVLKLVTSSFDTKQLLQQNGITVHEVKDFEQIDLYLDGCDQFDKNLNALKSGGGIHTHEKLLAAMAREFILVGEESKYAEKLDTKFPLAVELLPEALGFIFSRIHQLFQHVKTAVRINEKKSAPVVTTNGNYLLDIWYPEWPELSEINPLLKSIPGIIETSLFYGMAQKAIISGEKGTRIVGKEI